MITYINKNHKGYYVEFPEEIDSIYWEGQIGSTYEDFQAGKWVKLSNEQVAFHNEHKYASVREVLKMELDPTPVYERTLEDAKREMIDKITQYDNSEAVNSFTIGNAVMWLNVEERQQLATQIQANEGIGRENMTKWFNGISYTFPLTAWKQMLTALEVYAGDALNVTESHKHNVDLLETIEAVDNYNFMTGYPEKLSFNV